jgi:predicted amidohydrolase YtcJ
MGAEPRPVIFQPRVEGPKRQVTLGVGGALVLILVASMGGCNRPMSTHLADLIVRNGRVWTVDSRLPEASAVAVLGDRIIEVGGDSDVDRLRGPATRVIDAGGRLVLPGFNDSHVHFAEGGRNLLSVQLRDAATPEEFARRIGTYARTLPAGTWILGGDWDHELWPGSPLPTRQLIDALTPDHPVFVNRLDGHMALANSLALRLAGVGDSTKDPDGGTIVRDPSGNPTGLLKDAAADLVYRVIPAPDPAQRRRAILAALDEARRFGVTSVQDMSSAEEFATYQDLLKEGKLTVRISCRTPLSDYQRISAVGIHAGFGSAWLRTGSLKAFADGSLGSTTALFFEPYADAPNTSGLPAPMMFPEGNMKRLIARADAAGLQVTVHAIGDKANHLVLDMFEEVAKENPAWDRRFRIEHAQHLRADDIPRFSALGVVAAMQPYHAIDDGRWAEKRIGKERCKTTYAFRTLIDSGAKVAFGSDWYVAPLNPLLGIYAAVTRRTLDGKNPGGWYPEQKISAAEAIKSYTWTSAFAEFQETEKGTITAGKLADLVILSDDILAIPPEQIEKARVLYTIVGGRVVYEANQAKASLQP